MTFGADLIFFALCCFASVICMQSKGTLDLSTEPTLYYPVVLLLLPPCLSYTFLVKPETLTAVIAKEIQPQSLTTARLLQGMVRSRATPAPTPTAPRHRRSVGGTTHTPHRRSIGNTPLRGTSYSVLGKNLLPAMVQEGRKWNQR